MRLSPRIAVVATVLALVGCAPKLSGPKNTSTAPVVDPKPRVFDGPQLALLVKPSVVRVLDAYVARYTVPLVAEQVSVSVGGIGSGAVVSSDGHIVTNAHVVDVSHTRDAGGEAALERLALGQFVEKLKTAGAPYDVLYEAASARPDTARHFHIVIFPDGSHFEFRVVRVGASTSEGGQDVALLKVEDGSVRSVPVLRLGDVAEVKAAQHVTVVGYPGAADVTELKSPEGPYDKSYLDSSITDGKISATEKVVAGMPLLQYSAPTTHGNSGGPVVNDEGDVVGLATFAMSDASGFNFAVPSVTVRGFLDAAGVGNTLGPGDVLYREGLHLYGDGNLAEAGERFQRARPLLTHHSEIDELIQICARKTGSPAAPSRDRRATMAPVPDAVAPTAPSAAPSLGAQESAVPTLALGLLAALAFVGFGVLIVVILKR